jgi:type IV secretory pathway VirB2 component (pilin)
VTGDEAAHEEVTSPDQHRPTVSGRAARLGAIVTIIVLPLLAFFGNHQGGVEKVFLVGIAGFLLLMLIADFFLRRAGLRN